jgi:hypothetical protein
VELISFTCVLFAFEISQTTIKSASQCSSMPMLPLIFRCPVFKEAVQRWLNDDDDPPATCPACTRLHFVNRKTGKLFGDEKK